MREDNLQVQGNMPAKTCIANALFSVGNIDLTYIKSSRNEDLIPQTAPIGVIMTGGQLQVILGDQDENKYEAYVYYYDKHEGPTVFILETLKSIEEEQ